MYQSIRLWFWERLKQKLGQVLNLDLGIVGFYHKWSYLVPVVFSLIISNLNISYLRFIEWSPLLFSGNPTPKHPLQDITVSHSKYQSNLINIQRTLGLIGIPTRKETNVISPIS